MADYIHLDPKDPVIVALRDLAGDEPVGPFGLRTAQAVPQGHKVAVREIPAGTPVLKLGQVIGVATAGIRPGEHVHTHNLAMAPDTDTNASVDGRTAQPAALTGGDGPAASQLPPLDLPPVGRTTFDGIVRADGSIATRNYVGVLPTVNCSATAARLIAQAFQRPGALAAYPHVDGVVALTHRSGCVSNDESEAMALLRRTMGGYIRHPNFAAMLIVALGCEDNQLDGLLAQEGLELGGRLQALTIQEIGGTRAMVEAGVARIEALLPVANLARREQLAVSHLKLALQCGGSDGFSAITANPALGLASDLLVAHGGTAILSETPEVVDAEAMLLRRAVDYGVRRRFRELVAWWQAYIVRHGEPLESNVAHGNRAGGITTLAEKALGSTVKGGRSPLVAVYDYAEPVTARGLVFMDSPGYDPASVTGQVAGGANVVAFTTGRGSAFGCVPAPSLKLASNSRLYARMGDDMDLNCGEVVDSTATMEEMGVQIYDRILETASGRRTQSEMLGYGEEEFAPWHFGATT
jgi:altronate hydrolase